MIHIKSVFSWLSLHFGLEGFPLNSIKFPVTFLLKSLDILKNKCHLVFLRPLDFQFPKYVSLKLRDKHQVNNFLFCQVWTLKKFHFQSLSLSFDERKVILKSKKQRRCRKGSSQERTGSMIWKCIYVQYILYYPIRIS